AHRRAGHHRVQPGGRREPRRVGAQGPGRAGRGPEAHQDGERREGARGGSGPRRGGLVEEPPRRSDGRGAEVTGRSRPAAALLSLALSTACVTTRQEGQEMRARLDALEKDLRAEKAAAAADRARKKLDAGDTGAARQLFNEFLGKYKSDELAGNAQYWLGETYYAEKRWNEAIAEFQKVLKEHKKSEKTPDALLKIGMSFQAQADCKNALLVFDE